MLTNIRKLYNYLTTQDDEILQDIHYQESPSIFIIAITLCPPENIRAIINIFEKFRDHIKQDYFNQALNTKNLDLLKWLVNNRLTESKFAKYVNKINNIYDVDEIYTRVINDDIDFDYAELLIRLGANVNILIKSNDHTLMFKAIIYENYDFIKLLIDFGVNLEIAGTYSETPLMLACYAINGYGIIKLLIDSGAKINAQDYEGLTCIMKCSQPHQFNEMFNRYKREINRIEQLIGAGCDLNIQDVNGNTALMRAVLFNNYNVCKLLIDSGAKKDIRNNNNDTAFILASRKNNNNALIELIKENDDVYCEDVEEIKRMFFKTIQEYAFNRKFILKLIENNYDINNFTDSNGFYPIEIATEIQTKHISDVWYFLVNYATYYEINRDAVKRSLLDSRNKVISKTNQRASRHSDKLRSGLV